MQGTIQSTYKKRALHRLKIISGQVAGLQKMVEEEVYCPEVLQQSRAVQESLKSFDGLMLENHLTTHAAHELAGKNRAQAARELVKLYKFNNK